MDFAGRRPPPLVPRDRVFEVVERVLTDGSVHEPLDEPSVTRAAAAARRLGCEGVVICLINSYRNPAHERRVRDIVAAECGDDLFVVCSADVWRQSRSMNGQWWRC
jgi:N-methylhydantoinase A